jgi:hypothetical protein
MSSEFNDLFSTEGIRRTAPVPSALPWERDDAASLLKWLQPATSSTSIQDEALAKELTGDVPTPETALADCGNALAEFRKVFRPKERETFDLQKRARKQRHEAFLKRMREHCEEVD